MNQLIGKILRSKSLARKYEDELSKHGITIDYDQGQGVTLIGSNGKRLSSSTKEVFGPSKPGFGDTHREPDSWYKNRYNDYMKYAEDQEKELSNLDGIKKCVLRYATGRAKLEDDCDELETLRGYRDWYMLNDPSCKLLLEEYDTIGPILANKLFYDKENNF